jgi:enoyl-CoA hydratase/carnithine racemase
MATENILFTKDNGIATITLNCPQRKNAFDMEMVDAMADILVKWRFDPEVKVIVLTGAGDAFCSGYYFAPSRDLTATEETAYDQKMHLWGRIHRIPFALEDIDKPVIAALNGVAVGAGLDMALMCDIRFAAQSARFAEGYIRVGFLPGDGGGYFLPRLVGVSKALEMLWTGDFVTAPEALQIGLINRVYPDDQLKEETYKFARRLADGPTKVIQMMKRSVQQSAKVDLKTAMDLISSHMGIIRSTDDSKNAMRAAMSRAKK